jgi:hypothetical protein
MKKNDEFPFAHARRITPSEVMKKLDQIEQDHKEYFKRALERDQVPV